MEPALSVFIVITFAGMMVVGNCPRGMDRVAARFGWSEESGKPFFLMLTPFICLAVLAGALQ
jgi:hypothetical protein